MIPLEVARRVLIDEEPPLRVFRQWRGLSLDDLAAKTGLSRKELAEMDVASVLSPAAAATIAPTLKILADLLHD